MPLQSQLVSVVLFLAIASQLNLNCYAAAKGSNQASKKCQQYGHSCLGGHGKRSSPSSSASSSMPIPAFFSSSSSRVLPARSYSAGSGSGSPLSSTEQLYSFGGSPSSRPLSSSHFLSSSNNNKLPLVYTLLSAAFPSRKHQQLQQQPNWKSFQESSAVSSETVPESWAAAQAEQAEQYLVPLPPPVNGAPTDPDGGDLLQIREGLGSNFFSTGNFHRFINGTKEEVKCTPACEVINRVNLGGLLKVLHQFGHLILLVLLDGAQGGGGGRRIDALQAAGSGEGALQVGVLAGQSAGQRLQVVEILRSQLVEDARHHVGNALRLRLPGDGEGVRAQRRLHLRIVEVNDAAVLLEHVHLKREKG
ncbi:hypothetical protein TYRP_017414 [Tyrophagus putrescentiae]|nr:hypothetical protein TYRP_017414 [Tyrophagus putrescentiae]